MDKEAYAIIFGIKKFHQYLYGNAFTLYIDHRPLLNIFAPTKALPAYTALRMQHYAVFLQGYRFNIKYKNTKQHSNADCLSRLPIPETLITECDVIDIYKIGLIQDIPVSTEQLVFATTQDIQLAAIVKALHEKREVLTKLRFNINQAAFSLQSGILLCNGKVVIPKTLRTRVLRDLHTSHFSVAKMKSQARSLFWWPGIDRNIEELARNCQICNTLRNNPPKVEIHEWETVEVPFDRVHIDYRLCGAFFE